MPLKIQNGETILFIGDTFTDRSKPKASIHSAARHSCRNWA